MTLNTNSSGFQYGIVTKNVFSKYLVVPFKEVRKKVNLHMESQLNDLFE
jgi:hypothetical protein